MSTPTETQPTDTIRDAFEAMLWFLACLIGPLRPRKITPAEEIGALAACEVETDFEPDEPPAPLLALRDIIQRAAEEHVHPLRIVYGGADWTPERIREARERCERATPGPWRTVDRWDGSEVRSDPGTRVIVAVDLCAEDAAFIAHAREDLPAALREIERLTAELAVSTAENASLMQSSLDEIGRLTTALEQRRAPADASLEARALATISAVADINVTLTGTACAVERFWLAVVRAADASRPGLTEEQARAIVDDLNEAGDSPTVLVSAAAVRAMLDSRPASAVAKPDDRTLTEEQIDNVLRVALDVGKWDRPQGERMLRRFLRASRGETGPAPTWGEQAIEEHRRAADGITRVRVIEPPASPFGEWPEPERSGLTCPGCYAATGIATPCKGPLLSPAEQADPSFADALLVAQDRHREAAAVHPTTETDRQRSTLHAGDPAAVQYCACGAAVSPGEDHPTGPRHDVARRPQ